MFTAAGLQPVPDGGLPANGFQVNSKRDVSKREAYAGRLQTCTPYCKRRLPIMAASHQRV